ncbi:MAG: NAD-dependent deacylase [Armatimonadota bacterium]|nr:NAD-dependent deacylase [Armatimonadota bacterium]MDR7494776.1 NAD-dependent deacylase [Armatimonadota bacterium]MDR7499270.1 NAD-dependent deacylase [Armatimonadota bacterium]MDR7505094.1 NAD-dependent deacylase [Armatimonadota bacterium]MDR7547394.1 NAD-dependent deacylase [Armatimonadota bacterium]
MTDAIAKAAAVLARARRIAALTGAGVSTESGLPDFRSPGGLWAGVDPMEVASLTAFQRRPQVFYDFYRRRLLALAGAKPNPAHYALVTLERFGLQAVITQNVDGLHQAAGSRRVIELHGNLREAACVACRAVRPIAVLTEALDRGELPTCSTCGGPLKPNVVLFEELLPAAAYAAAEQECRLADVLLVAGSSLQVTPAAWLPEVARESGAAILIVNDEPTPLDHRAEVVLRGRAGAVLPALAAAVSGQRGERETSR